MIVISDGVSTQPYRLCFIESNLKIADGGCYSIKAPGRAACGGEATIMPEAQASSSDQSLTQPHAGKALRIRTSLSSLRNVLFLPPARGGVGRTTWRGEVPERLTCHLGFPEATSYCTWQASLHCHSIPLLEPRCYNLVSVKALRTADRFSARNINRGFWGSACWYYRSLFSFIYTLHYINIILRILLYKATWNRLKTESDSLKINWRLRPWSGAQWCKHCTDPGIRTSDHLIRWNILSDHPSMYMMPWKMYTHTHAARFYICMYV